MPKKPNPPKEVSKAIWIDVAIKLSVPMGMDIGEAHDLGDEINTILVEALKKEISKRALPKGCRVEILP